MSFFSSFFRKWTRLKTFSTPVLAWKRRLSLSLSSSEFFLSSFRSFFGSKPHNAGTRHACFAREPPHGTTIKRRAQELEAPQGRSEGGEKSKSAFFFFFFRLDDGGSTPKPFSLRRLPLPLAPGSPFILPAQKRAQREVGSVAI